MGVINANRHINHSKNDRFDVVTGKRVVGGGGVGGGGGGVGMSATKFSKALALSLVPTLSTCVWPLSGLVVFLMIVDVNQATRSSLSR